MNDAIGIPFDSTNFLKDSIFDGMVTTDRQWTKILGIAPEEDIELLLKRTMFACSQQFNFWQDAVPGSGLNDKVWKWDQHDGKTDFFSVMNLRPIREKIIESLTEYLTGWPSLYDAIQTKQFWQEFNKVINLGVGDVVFKKAILLKMICDDLNLPVWNTKNWGFACVDYNALIMLNYIGWLDVAGGLWSKSALDKKRVLAYTIITNLVKSSGLKYTDVDAYFYFGGRQIRKAYGDDTIPRVLNEINY